MYELETARAVLEAVDGLVGRYLSDNLRNEIWNELVRRFPLPKEDNYVETL